jgi:hypothetical protein
MPFFTLLFDPPRCHEILRVNTRRTHVQEDGRIATVDYDVVFQNSVIAIDFLEVVERATCLAPNTLVLDFNEPVNPDDFPVGSMITGA